MSKLLCCLVSHAYLNGLHYEKLLVSVVSILKKDPIQQSLYYWKKHYRKYHSHLSS